MEIRPEKPLYNAIPTCVYPRQRLIPELKRSGYRGEFYRLTPFDLFHALLTDSRAETLLKAGQIHLLRFFVNNVEHDRYVRKKRERLERERREQARKKALEDEALFREMKSRFFGIQFTDGLIRVRMLESVEEIMQEGDIMHHCVFVSQYHLKPDSLILSASVDGKRVETVEFSLSQMQVIQSRGAGNRHTEYHDRIIELVKKNISLIRKRKRNAA